MRLDDAGRRSLIDLLRDRAAASPDLPAYTFLDDGETPRAPTTWAALERRSRAIAVAVGSAVAPGARVLVMFPPSPEFAPAFFGVQYAGAIAVAAYPPLGARADRALDRLRGMIADAGITLAIAPARHAELAIDADPALRALQWIDPTSVDDTLADEWREVRVDAQSLAFLQYTSGSTASPRGVMVSHGNLLHNLARTAAQGQYNSSAVSVSWLPVNHDMGLINGLLQPVYSGYHAYLMAPAAFLQRPARWLRAVSRFGVTHSGGPNFAYDLCVRRISDEERSTLDLSSWRVAYNGSEPVRRGTLEAFQARFGECGFRWESLSPAYGLAESTLLVASVPAGRSPEFIGSAVASGFVENEDGILIVEPDTRTALPEAASGEIWVRSDSVAGGYWGRPLESAETFAATTSTGDGPYLRTGDIGFLDRGALFVTGRLKDILIVRGVKHHPHDVELTAERSHPALRSGCCAAVAIEDGGEERVALVAEVDAKEYGRERQHDLATAILSVRVAVGTAHQISLHTVALVAAGTLPKTTSGKLQRYLCREALTEQRVELLAAWTADTLAESVAS